MSFDELLVYLLLANLKTHPKVSAALQSQTCGSHTNLADYLGAAACKRVGPLIGIREALAQMRATNAGSNAYRAIVPCFLQFSFIGKAIQTRARELSSR